MQTPKVNRNTNVHCASRVMLRLPKVMAKLGVGRSTVYAWEAAGMLPKRIALGPRAVGWFEDELDGFLAGRLAKCDKEAA